MNIIRPYLIQCFRIIHKQIDAMSTDDELAFIRRFCFDQMCGDKINQEGKRMIECESFVTSFPTLMESLFEFSKLIPAFRERVSRSDIDISLNEQIKIPQQGDDLLQDDDFSERWIMALEQMTE